MALAALWYPGQLSGIFDGAPFDTAPDAIVLGLLFPVLFWLAQHVTRDRRFRALALVLLGWKVLCAFTLAQDGMCVRVVTPQSEVAVKNWDVRTDWRSDNPACSAVADRPFLEERQLPIWYPFNFPEAPSGGGDSAAPRQVARLTMSGTVVADQAGTLRLWTSPTVDARLSVDGQEGNSHGQRLDVGEHRIVIDATLVDANWILAPLWNDGSLFRSLTTTVTPPSTADRWARPWARWISLVLVAALLLLSVVLGAAAIGDRQVLAWMGASAAAGALLPALLAEGRWHYALLLLLAACAIRMPAAWRNVRGAALLLAPAWLALNIVDTYRDQGFGRMDFITPGNDWWAFQLYAYRIYMQGHWLQGGEAAFWYQPFYRWIAGALHMLFGQSQVGENYWDAIGVLIIALFSFEVVRRLRGFRWGCAAAVLALAAFVAGPGYIFIGRGLSEISSAALIYLAALAVIRARDTGSLRLLIVAGCVVVLGVWTRLNNLPIALGIAVFAWPISEPSSTLLKPRTWLANAWYPPLFVIPGALAVGMLLFAWRTWYYTGFFSIFYGTQAATLAVRQPGMPAGDVVRAMIDSVAMVATTVDPPAYHNGALPILAGAALSVAALTGLGWLGRLPLAPVAFTLAAFSSALVARGTAYSGRFSVHVVGATVAVVMCAIAVLAPGKRTADLPLTGSIET